MKHSVSHNETDAEAEPDQSPASLQPCKQGTASPASSAWKDRPVTSDADFDQFYRDCFQPAVGWVRHKYHAVARDAQTAEGLVADAFAKTWEKRHQIKKNPYAFLLNQIKDLVRPLKKLATPAMGTMGNPGASDDAEAYTDRNVADPQARRPVSQLGSVELREIFEEDALASLPPEYREVVELHFKQGMDFIKIEERLGVDRKTAQKRCERALHQLKDFMAGRDSSIARRHPAKPSDHPIRTRRAAIRAIESLPKPYSTICGVIYVSGMNLDDAAVHLKLPSAGQAQEYLDRGHEILRIRYGLEIPGDLVAALSGEGKARETKP